MEVSPATIWKNRAINLLQDVLVCWYYTTWRKKARLVLKAAQRYLNYNRDTARHEAMDAVKEKMSSLKSALFAGEKEQTKTLTKELEGHLESIPKALPNALAENVEMLFVILVIFLGIRSYIAQPFRIPTGSMQPSLNGIRAHDVAEDPSFAIQAWDMLRYGSSYVNHTSTGEKQLQNYIQGTKYLLLTNTTLVFSDGTSLEVPCAEGEVRNYFMGKFGTPFPAFRSGETIINTRFDAGDLIIVNKMSYHFRKPARGEVFVFDTRGINTRGTQDMADQAGGTHFVKRLCGLPGDTLEIQDPQLLINNKPATEPTIQRVIQGQAPYNAAGYMALHPEPGVRLQRPKFLSVGKKPSLANPDDKPHLREYVALGDNTKNSLDSRYWGTVRQFNIAGPAVFVLWPLTDHWGNIP